MQPPVCILTSPSPSPSLSRCITSGYAKTRLILALGAEGAAHVSRQLTERCMREITSLYYTGNDCTESKMREWLGDNVNANVEHIPQVGDDLGVRLRAAVCTSFASGCNGMVACNARVVYLGVCAIDAVPSGRCSTLAFADSLESDDSCLSHLAMPWGAAGFLAACKFFYVTSGFEEHATHSM